jgi:Cu/Ag efflux pump CusA
VAQVRIAANPTVVRHDAVSRFVEVGARIDGRNPGAVVREIEERLEALDFPIEHRARIIGAYAVRRSDQIRFVAVAAAVVLGLYLLLQAAVGSWRLATALALALPAALTGGLVSALIYGRPLTIGSFAGFLVLFALAFRGAITSVHHFRRLAQDEGLPFAPDLVHRGATERLPAVLTSAVATAAALVPLTLGRGRAGFEVITPLAVVVLGGLVTTTFVTLIVVPALHARFGAMLDLTPYLVAADKVEEVVVLRDATSGSGIVTRRVRREV